jgi:hypothetical protein
VLLHRVTAWVSTALVAIVVAVAMPVSQLRTVSIVKECCCPDPAKCHCPDHELESSQQPSLRACHNTEEAVIAPQLPVFSVAVAALAVVPAITAAVVEHPLRSPHPPPLPRRPDAPS